MPDLEDLGLSQVLTHESSSENFSRDFISTCLSLKLSIANSPHFPGVKGGATPQETAQSVRLVPGSSMSEDGRATPRTRDLGVMAGIISQANSHPEYTASETA